MPAPARILILAACSAALAAHGQAPLPEGNGKAAVERMCTNCHQLDVITGQRLSQPRWAAKVDEMVALGARGSDSDRQQVVAYLAAHFGNGSSTMTSAGAATVESAPLPDPASPLATAPASITSRYDLKGDPGVTYQRILHAALEPQNWLTFNGAYRSNHYSLLAQVTPANIHNLELKWVFPSRSLDAYEATPLVVDGVLYTMQGDNVVALDAVTGRLFWIFRYDGASDVRLCCGRVNRGVAILGTTIFVAEADNHLIAIDARTGKAIWNRTVAKTSSGYSMTGAPLVLKDKVIIGVAGGEYGVRGFIEAFDARSGNEDWRFYTIPAPGEPGGDTWGGDSWKHGGGAAWLTGSFDPEANLLFWGVGNAGPDYNGDVRPGDNLYTSSMLALDPDTGKLQWYYQANPHNEFDWDAVQVPLLVDETWHGKPRKLLLWANRNGFYYVLDRGSGEFLLAKAFVRQNWNLGFDAKGRPIMAPDAHPTAAGTSIFPDLQGGTNWFAASYSVRTGLFYVNARDNQSFLYTKAPQEYEEGTEYKSGGHTGKRPPEPVIGGGEDQYAAVRALDPKTGVRRWEFKLNSGFDLATYHDYKADHGAGGILTTASDLLFTGGREGSFLALDARTGKLLWNVQLGGAILMNPMTYSVHGRQYIAVDAGTSLYVFGLKP
jgi:alcohol dehydrogenase (cytochrome c)